jgi:hypothetical protein
MVPLEELVQHNAIEEPSESQTEKDTGSNQWAASVACFTFRLHLGTSLTGFNNSAAVQFKPETFLSASTGMIKIGM